MGNPTAKRVFSALLAEESALDDIPMAGDYFLSHELGHGGGGTVFAGRRPDSDHEVAVKVLDQPLDGGRIGRRACRELELLTQLRLPCVPQVHDYGLHGGRLYIATERVDGATLSEYCRVHDFDRWQRVGLLARVADAVQSIHEHGVIHHDLKPDNILIDARGEPVIVDLGIASALSECAEGSPADESVPIGTPGFMSPEQARGEREAVSTRSDVYSLGATACHVLTGQTPHGTGTSVQEAIRRAAQDPPRSPRALDPKMPKALASVLARALSPQPAHRYASAAGFAEGLRESIEAAGPSILERARFWTRRHPDQVMWALALTVAVAASAVLGVRSVGRAEVAADYRAKMEEYRRKVRTTEESRKERRERQIARVRLALQEEELFDATLVLLHVAEDIEADRLDDREALRRFTQVLGELFDAAAAERRAGSPEPGESE